jgi:hypothetical protein
MLLQWRQGEWRVCTAGSIFRRRSWIALTAVYALVLQVLLSGVLIGQLGAASITADGLSAICATHGSSIDADGTGSGQQPSAHEPVCVFCTAAGGPAVLPVPSIVADVPFLADSSPQADMRDVVVAFASPTWHYQRGPPESSAFAG